MSSPRAVLRDVFGFTEFRPNQEEIVEAVLAGRDVFAAMPTGGGKSICYQLPALLLPGLTVVVSPLLALMKDQVDAARELGLPAAFLNSALDAEEAREVYRDLFAGRLKLLYISPERFSLEGFAEKLSGFDVALFAVDEAHCLSEWGHDFRPDYLGLAAIRDVFPRARIAAFTATATTKVQEDIIGLLALKDPFVVRASFDRRELFYEVAPKVDVLRQILEFVEARPGEAGIVYRTSRADVEKTAAFLKAKGIKAVPYHAGLPQARREKHQDLFNRDKADVVVATIAFGMGIDKSNIRFVVHGDLPKSVEGYYQETGRAGRDGLDSRCLLLFGRGDVARQSWFIERTEDAEERERARKRLRRMADFASVNVCRRKQLLEYFDEPHPGNCGACDVCTGVAEEISASEEARMLLSAVARTGERFGLVHVVDVVTGADTEKVRRFGHDRLRTFGVGGDRPKGFWLGLAGDLIAQGCLRQNPDRYNALELTASGRDVLFGREEFRVLKRAEPGSAKKKRGGRKGPGKEARADAKIRGGAETEGDAAAKSAAGLRRAGADEGLFERLRLVRLDIAGEKNLPPYVVFSDKTLREMCRLLPETREELLEVSGVGEHKLEAYGGRFLAEIGRWRDRH